MEVSQADVCINEPHKSNAEDFPGSPVVENLPANAGDMGWIPSPGDSTCLKTTKPLCHNYWSHQKERFHAPQLESRPAAAAAKSLQSRPTLRPHRRQPTRIPRPWDSPGKNTGVGCHFLLQCMKGKVKVKLLSCVRLLSTPWTAAHQAPPSMRFSR